MNTPMGGAPASVGEIVFIISLVQTGWTLKPRSGLARGEREEVEVGLFGPGTGFYRMGDGPPAIAARKAIEDIAGRLETELDDSPSEYFALQAGGMYFASETKAVEGVKPVQSLDDSLARATQIMAAFADGPRVERGVLTRNAKDVYNLLCMAVFEGRSQPALLVGHLNDYLVFLEASHLQRRRAEPRRRLRRLWPFWICAFTVLILVSFIFVISRGTSKAELDRTFIVSLKGKPMNQREAFVEMNKGKTITLTGTVKGAGSGGFSGSMVLLSLETEDAPNKEPGGVDISVALDDHPFAACGYDPKEPSKATCKHLDGSTETIASGEKLTVTGYVLYCRGDWFDRSLLMIGSAVIDKRYGAPRS